MQNKELSLHFNKLSQRLQNPSFQDILQSSQSLAQRPSIQFSYIDADGDTVRVSNQMDLDMAFEHVEHQLDLKISVINESGNESLNTSFEVVPDTEQVKKEIERQNSEEPARDNQEQPQPQPE